MDIAQRLRSEGFKATPQRVAIYNAVYGSSEHPTAEMIYQSLRSEHPAMSLATVYKTMEILTKIGLVRVLDMGDDCFHYDWDTRTHAHLRCVRCNRVEDVEGLDVDDFVHHVEEKSAYRVTRQQLAFEGICPECLHKELN